MELDSLQQKIISTTVHYPPLMESVNPILLNSNMDSVIAIIDDFKSTQSSENGSIHLSLLL